MITEAQTAEKVQATPGRRALRWLMITLAAVMVTAVLLLSALTAALSTDRSSQWLLATASDMLSSDNLQLHYDWYEGTFARGLTLYQVRIQLGENRITMDRLHSRWNPFTLLGGQFNLDALHIAGLQAHWFGDEAPPEPAVTEPFDLAQLLDGLLPLPVAVRLADVVLEQTAIHYDDLHIEVPALRLVAALNQRQLDIESLHLDAMDALLDASLQIELLADYTLALTAEWSYADTAAGSLQLNGDLNTLTLSHLMAHPAQLRSEGEISLGLADVLNNRAGSDGDLPLTIDLLHELESADIGLEALAGLALPAATVRTSGNLALLDISGSTGISVNEPLPVTGITADAVWQLQLIDMATLNIEQLSLSTGSGMLEVDGEIDWQDLPQIALNISLDESAPTAYVDTFPEDITLTDLRANLTVALTLGDGGPRGNVELSALEMVLNNTTVSGNSQISLQSTDAFDIDSLSLRAGNNEIQFSGGLRSNNIQGQLQVSANDLSVIYPPLAGQLQGDVQINGELPLPALDIDLIASTLRYEDIALAQLQLSGSVQGDSNSLSLQLRELLVAEQLIEFVSAQLQGALDDHQLSLSVTSDIVSMALEAAGAVDGESWRGTLDQSWFDTDIGHWQQSAATAVLLSAENVNLEQACWQQNGSRLCLQATLDEVRQLEASASLADYPLSVLNSTRANTLMRSFHNGELPIFLRAPQGLQMPFTLPTEMALIGDLALQADVSGPLDDLDALRVNVNLATSDTALYLLADLLPEDDDDDASDDTIVEQFLWPEAWATARLESGNWQLQAMMELLQHDRTDSGEALRGLLELSMGMDAEQALEGELSLDFDGMGWLAALTPQIQAPRGRIRGAVLVGGILQDPTFDLDIAVAEAGMTVAALGLPIENISARLQGSHDSALMLQASARSGDGNLSVDAMIEQPLEDHRSLQLSLQGENFRIANLPELQATISPDLRVIASSSGINTMGELRIPALNAAITELPETAVDVSSDAILVSQREDREPVRNAAQGDLGTLADIPISINVRVILGEAVHFEGFGLNARLGGQLDINQRPGSAPLAYGELQVVEGAFETYGRVLDIEQGQLLFFGPLDNPGLDIRAVRQVDTMRVGVQMNGTLRNIRSSLFSTPTLPDADIVSVLITGRPLAELGTQQEDSNALIGAITNLGISQGQGLTDQVRGQLGLDTLALESSGDLQDSSLTLGKYITPRIFIRYAVGLFETESVLGIDYSITDNIRLEARSGHDQSVDVTYTLER